MGVERSKEVDCLTSVFGKPKKKKKFTSIPLSTINPDATDIALSETEEATEQMQKIDKMLDTFVRKTAFCEEVLKEKREQFNTLAKKTKDKKRLLRSLKIVKMHELKVERMHETIGKIEEAKMQLEAMENTTMVTSAMTGVYKFSKNATGNLKEADVIGQMDELAENMEKFKELEDVLASSNNGFDTIDESELKRELEEMLDMKPDIDPISLPETPKKEPKVKKEEPVEKTKVAEYI